MVAGLQADVDERGLGGADAVFEGILDERNEDEGCHGCGIVGLDIDVSFNLDVIGQADFHQFNIIAHEVSLLAQGHKILLILIEHVAQELAQLSHRGLGLVLVKCDEGIDVV